MNAIVAVDENWNIGKDNDLLVRIPEDLKRFKEMTSCRMIIMGRKTAESLPNGEPLKGRMNTLLTRNTSYKRYGFSVYNDITDLLMDIVPSRIEDVFIIGGSEIYNLLMPLIDTFYVTKIHKTFPEANKSIYNLDQFKGIEKVDESEVKYYNDIAYQYLTYKKTHQLY